MNTKIWMLSNAVVEPSLLWRFLIDLKKEAIINTIHTLTIWNIYTFNHVSKSFMDADISSSVGWRSKIQLKLGSSRRDSASSLVMRLILKMEKVKIKDKGPVSRLYFIFRSYLMYEMASSKFSETDILLLMQFFSAFTHDALLLLFFPFSFSCSQREINMFRNKSKSMGAKGTRQRLKDSGYSYLQAPAPFYFIFLGTEWSSNQEFPDRYEHLKHNLNKVEEITHASVMEYKGALAWNIKL